ncbi:SPRY domain-containing protein 3-like [Thrips palmi]|uniref:SPRY domain-containing protein 3-like n=1 Tax=Thrips palmi TaxID=161013 RepID=A0A6P8Y2G8_THRPL|nr:SPRY domain-containing protein 3-like [Thrips palmi]XP_034230495.1 SPRY domain-containing protein 3-like [Thrips palmi]
MQSCIRPKFFGQSNLVVALRKIFDTLNEKKKMEGQGGSGAATIRTDEDCHDSAGSSEEAGTERTPSVCRHANVCTDDNEFISYAPELAVGKIGLWISGSKLTAEVGYFEMEITDCGVDGKIHIGVASWKHPLHSHIGHSLGSIGLSVENGHLFKDGEMATDTVRVKVAREYDRVGCGLRYEQHFDSGDDADDTESFVLVYFTLNGKEIGSLWTHLPLGGFHPAVSMQSPGEEVRVCLGLPGHPMHDDDEMIVDSNEDDWCRLSDVHQRGQYLEYCGKGQSIADVGLAQARFPLNTTHHYFEIEIVDPGENCYIAIGLTRKDYPDRRNPGWNKGSIGYHADDGKIFMGSGKGDPFGPRCHKGDRMGCGIYFAPDYISEYDSDCDVGNSPPRAGSSNGKDVELIDLTVDTSGSEDDEWWTHQGKVKCGSKVEIFFTRNGKTVGMRQVRIPKGGFYPTVGMLGLNEKVRVDLRPLTG